MRDRLRLSPVLIAALFPLLLAGCPAGQTNQLSAGTGGAGGAGGTGGGDGGFSPGAGGGGGDSDTVPQTCADAVASRSYIGCEYWPVVTSNSLLATTFHFAIAAANPTGSDAKVTVERNGQTVGGATVPAGQLETIVLPWVDELRAPPGSAIVQHGAYHVTSSVPITLYQFNPLEFESSPGCMGGPFSGCNSFTNDASLLLPTTGLRGEYVISAYPTSHYGDQSDNGITWVGVRGLASVVATADNTTVTLSSLAHIAPGSGVPALGPGQTGTYKLNAGDVLQVLSDLMPSDPLGPIDPSCTHDDFGSTTTYYCPTPQAYDLTGSWVKADKPVEVLGGHDCAFVPFNTRACDHLEESVFPVETLGTDLLVTATQSIVDLKTPGTPDYQYVRVLSAADNNKITFDPEGVHGPVTLNKGQWIELGPFLGDVHVHGDDRLLVSQFMVGQNYRTGGQADNHLAGDPSMSVAIPAEQYRSSYEFLAPLTYTYSYVNLIAKKGATITLDGAPVPEGEFKPIGASGWGVARHPIMGGAHSAQSSSRFGIVVYGYASYTSYMYPGGLNLGTVIIPPK